MKIYGCTFGSFKKFWESIPEDSELDDFHLLLHISPSYRKWVASNYYPGLEGLYKYVKLYPQEGINIINEIRSYVKSF